MTAGLTDNFTLVSTAGSETTLAAPGKAINATSLNITSSSGWPTTTGIVFAMRRVDSSGNYVAGTYTEWEGVLSGTAISLGGSPSPLYGTDQVYAADGLTQVFQPLSSSWSNKIINTILAQHTQAGAHIGLTNTGGANFTGGITTDSLTITGSNVAAGWNALGQTLTYASNNGFGEFTVTAAANLLSTISPGMKIQVTRGTAPPTQCANFVSASSQYATKSSPTGLSFTSAFTCEAWINLQSYTGGYQTLISRRSGSAGAWFMRINTVGQLDIGYGDASGNFTVANSNQSIPLNQPVHVAGVVSSVSSKTILLYINGLLVTNTLNTSASTTLVQAGNLSIGCYGAGSGDFANCYISEARVWSVAQTATAIQNNMAINLTGSESNLVGLWKFNGAWTDATTNANTLTANGGAINNQATNPFNAIEYGTIIAASYSAPNTTITIFTGTQNTIPNMTLNSAQYSTSANPYGLPANLRKYKKTVLMTNTFSTTSSAPVQVPGLAIPITIPIGVPYINCTIAANSLGDAGGVAVAEIWDGVVGSGTQLVQANAPNASSQTLFLISTTTSTAGTHTFNIGLGTPAGTANIYAASTYPAIFTVEVDL